MITVGTAPILFQGRATANQTHATANGYYAVNFATEDVDDGDGHSTTTNPSRYVIQRAGLYRCSGTALWSAGQAVTTGTTNRVAGITKNAGFLPSSGVFGTYAGALYSQVCQQVDTQCVAGDYIELYVAAGLANAVTYGDSGIGSMLRVEFIR